MTLMSSSHIEEGPSLPGTDHGVPDEPLRTHDDLFAIFFDAMKPTEAYRIGPEMEKFGVFHGRASQGAKEAAGAPIPYEGDKGVVRLLRELESRYGWTAEWEYEGGPILSLRRGESSITLEPGCQFELSGAAVATVHEVDDEFRGHLTELAPLSRELGILWLGLGFQPFATRDELSWVPKLRYGVMRKYLPTRGPLALDMMLRTSTVQANFDYSSEEDAIRKLKICLKLSPLTTALFANSPFYEGKPHGGVTYRGRVWLDVDPDRSGLLPALWKPGAGIEAYVQWALDAPMFMFKRDGKRVDNSGQKFRDFWKDGFEGHKPTQGDWQTHLNTLFPEVRLKRTLEVRGADAQTSEFASALPALYTGLLYDEQALAAAEALTEDFTYDEVEGSRKELWRLGLRTPFRNGDWVPWAEKILTLSEAGLARRNCRNKAGHHEGVYLEALKELVAHGQSPAHLHLDNVAKSPLPFREAVMQSAELRIS